MKQTDVLILAPHPDDEFLNCTAILMHARNVRFIYATNGDFTDRHATDVRYSESLAAMRAFGLGPEAMVYLGYGDRGGKRSSSFLAALWDSDPKTLHESSVGTQTYGPEGHAEYHFRRYGTHAPYTRHAFLQDLTEVLLMAKPRFLFLPSILDAHWDHRCLNMLTRSALSKLDKPPACYIFLTHYGRDACWPNRAGEDFKMPPGFPPDEWARRIQVPVSAAEKVKLLARFSSQQSGDGYIDAFCKRQELYWREMMEG